MTRLWTVAVMASDRLSSQWCRPDRHRRAGGRPADGVTLTALRTVAGIGPHARQEVDVTLTVLSTVIDLAAIFKFPREVDLTFKFTVLRTVAAGPQDPPLLSAPSRQEVVLAFTGLPVCGQ